MELCELPLNALPFDSLLSFHTLPSGWQASSRQRGCQGTKGKPETESGGYIVPVFLRTPILTDFFRCVRLMHAAFSVRQFIPSCQESCTTIRVGLQAGIRSALKATAISAQPRLFPHGAFMGHEVTKAPRTDKRAPGTGFSWCLGVLVAK